jgi:hypothetical protein
MYWFFTAVVFQLISSRTFAKVGRVLSTLLALWGVATFPTAMALTQPCVPHRASRFCTARVDASISAAV